MVPSSKINTPDNFEQWRMDVLPNVVREALLKCAEISFFSQIGTVSIAKPRDIAVMKITAISQRGKKRDFFDLYWISLNIQPLIESIKALQIQYSVRQNLTHILKSLVYFDDAETDPDPEVYFPADWKKVKKFFTDEIKAIAERIIK